MTTPTPPARESADGLSPCPFCGHSAVFRDGHGQDAGGVYVQCVSLSCLASSIIMFPEMDDVKPLLAEKWNKRAAAKSAADAHHAARVGEAVEGGVCACDKLADAEARAKRAEERLKIEAAEGCKPKPGHIIDENGKSRKIVAAEYVDGLVKVGIELDIGEKVVFDFPSETVRMVSKEVRGEQRGD